MDRIPLFSIADDKLGRIATELDRLASYLARSDQADDVDVWSRTATIAFTLHGAYTGIEDVLSDVARSVDGSAPQGMRSHQALLEQMRAPIEGHRPPPLDDTSMPLSSNSRVSGISSAITTAWISFLGRELIKLFERGER